MCLFAKTITKRSQCMFRTWQHPKTAQQGRLAGWQESSLDTLVPSYLSRPFVCTTKNPTRPSITQRDFAMWMDVRCLPAPTRVRNGRKYSEGYPLSLPHPPFSLSACVGQQGGDHLPRLEAGKYTAGRGWTRQGDVLAGYGIFLQERRNVSGWIGV